MKTTFKLNMSAGTWKTPGHIPTCALIYHGKPDARTYYKGGASYTVPKALKAVRKTLQAQGRAYSEVCTPDGWLTITAE